MAMVVSESISGYAAPACGSSIGSHSPGLLSLAVRLRNLIARHRHNFHTVSPHALYRSGQLGRSRLVKCLEEHRIRSVINLRGANPHSAWHREERQTAARLGIEHHDFRLRSERLPTREELRWLVFLLDLCPRPVLIHCKAGAERSGLASAIFLLLNAGGSVAKAKSQLSLRYRVVPWHGVVRTWQRLIQLYSDWLAGQGHTPEHFRRWACKIYAP